LYLRDLSARPKYRGLVKVVVKMGLTAGSPLFTKGPAVCDKDTTDALLLTSRGRACPEDAFRRPLQTASALPQTLAPYEKRRSDAFAFSSAWLPRRAVSMNAPA
jgi:hypothetical protein